MLKAAGITAEYNPLHNGHVYHIGETRRVTGCDAVVVAMSGDYVQRGEPAIMDKWVRTEHALRSGADLVLEIPVLFCLGNAGQYASAAVKILEATGKVSHISFGSESGDGEALVRIAKVFRDNGSEIEAAIRSIRGKGFSYPVARALAYSEVMADKKGTDPDSDPEILNDIQILNKANDILAVEYIRAMRNAEPAVIHREGAGYGEPLDERMVYQSASALRTQVLEGVDISGYVPGSAADALKTCQMTRLQCICSRCTEDVSSDRAGSGRLVRLSQIRRALYRHGSHRRLSFRRRRACITSESGRCFRGVLDSSDQADKIKKVYIYKTFKALHAARARYQQEQV